MSWESISIWIPPPPLLYARITPTSTPSEIRRLIIAWLQATTEKEKRKKCKASWLASCTPLALKEKNSIQKANLHSESKPALSPTDVILLPFGKSDFSMKWHKVCTFKWALSKIAISDLYQVFSCTVTYFEHPVLLIVTLHPIKKMYKNQWSMPILSFFFDLINLHLLDKLSLN